MTTDPHAGSGEPSAAQSADLSRLLRWETAGGTWQVLRRSDRDALISLCRCDGGEEADRYVATAPDLLAHLDRTGGIH